MRQSANCLRFNKVYLGVRFIYRWQGNLIGGEYAVGNSLIINADLDYLPSSAL